MTCELVSSSPRERGSELEGAGIGEPLLRAPLGRKKLSFSLAGTLLVRRTDYEHWASGSVALASTVLEKNDRLRYSAIKITTWLRINLRSAGPHAKQGNQLEIGSSEHGMGRRLSISSSCRVIPRHADKALSFGIDVNPRIKGLGRKTPGAIASTLER